MQKKHRKIDKLMNILVKQTNQNRNKKQKKERFQSSISTIWGIKIYYLSQFVFTIARKLLTSYHKLVKAKLADILSHNSPGQKPETDFNYELKSSVGRPVFLLVAVGKSVSLPFQLQNQPPFLGSDPFHLQNPLNLHSPPYTLTFYTQLSFLRVY